MSNKNSIDDKIKNDGKEEAQTHINNNINLKKIETFTTKILSNPSNKNKENGKEVENKKSPEIINTNIKKNNNNDHLNKKKQLKKSLLKSTLLSLSHLGRVEDAEIHRYANIPLKKMGEKNKDTIICSCCGRPSKQEGVFEKYKYSDSTDDFVICGQAISLYFSFYIYSIFILIIAFLSISLPSLIISYYRSDELNKLCNKIYDKNNIKECKIYLDHADYIEDENKSRFNFIVDFSGLNIKNYRIIHGILIENENNNLDNIFINYSILNFFGIWTILLIYFGYIILINNKKLFPGIDSVSPKNYSILITGMDGFYSFLKTKTNYLSIIKGQENKENNTEDMKQSSERETIDDKSLSGVNKFENIFQEKLSELFFDEKKQYDIQKVNVCFKINKFVELTEKLEEYIDMEKFIKLPYQDNKNMGVDKSKRIYYYSPLDNFNIHICEKEKKLSDIKKERSIIEKELNKLQQEAKEMNMDKFAGAVIISFNTVKEKEEFLSHIPKSLFLQLLKMIGTLRYFLCCCCIKKIDNSYFVMKHLKINIEEAPHSQDIIFENLEFTQQSKVYRVVGINMISLLLIAIGFGIILGFRQLQVHVDKKDYNQIIHFIISICISIVTSIINIIFEELLDMLTKHEKQSSITNLYLSYSIKLTIFYFLVKAIIPLAVEKILGTSDYEVLITNMMTIFLMNSLVTPILWTIKLSPIYWIKKIKIYLTKKNPSKYVNMSQKKLNKLYEKTDMLIAEKYSYIAYTLLMTFLYTSIFPFGVLISLGGFILCYFLEKYNFINKYKSPEVLDDSIFMFYMKNYIIFLFFIGVGDYIFLSDVLNNKGWSLVNIIFSGILSVIPFNYFLNIDFIGFKESEINTKTYKEAYLDLNFFCNTYERINPISKDESTKYYIEKLYENNIISKEQRDKHLKNFENIDLMELYYLNRKNRNNEKIKMSMGIQETNNFLKNLLPNQKKLLKFSSRFSSFINPNKNENQKTVSDPNQIVNPFINKQPKDNIILSINNEINNILNKNTQMKKEKEPNLNEIEIIKEESKIDVKQLEQKVDKIEKIIDKKNLQIQKKFNKFYNNIFLSRIYGSFQVYNYLNKNKDEDDEDLKEIEEKSEDDSSDYGYDI